MNAIVRAGMAHIETLQQLMQEGFERGIFHEFDYEPEHIHADGLYARKTRTLPAGLIIITKVHKKQNIAVALKGTVTVFDQDGNKSIVGPGQVFITEPGTQRAIYCHDEVEWLTIHAAESTDVDELESMIFCDNFAEFDALLEDMRIAA